MGGAILFVIYALLGKLCYELLKSRHGKDADTRDYDHGLYVFFGIIWPLTMVGFIYYTLIINTPLEPPPSEPTGPFEPWAPKPPAGDYNSAHVSREKNAETVEDMAAFIKALETRPDTPLPEALTFSYKLTGISKTYRKGTMFPSALIRDWKRGFYMGEEKEEA